MADLFEYLAWRGDLDFSKQPLNPVDNIIFCQLSYLPFDGIVPGISNIKDRITIRQAAQMFADNYKHNINNIKFPVMFKNDPLLLQTLASSKRFANCRLSCYVNHIDDVNEVQFSAILIETTDGFCFVTYRGTDLSLTGWKEDFNMSFCEVIPAQLKAVEYLEHITRYFKGPFRLGGHSKGGNLAVFAASQCKKRIQKRITEIYSNDAPGFHENFIASKGFAAVKSKIKSYIPQSSVVGMMLEHGCDYNVIKSNKPGLLQHELYSWEVTHNDMVHAGEITQGSRFVNKTLKEWLANQDVEKREIFINALFSILKASQAKTIIELEKSWFAAVTGMIKTLGNIDSETRHLIRNMLGDLFNAARHNINTLLKIES